MDRKKLLVIGAGRSASCLINYLKTYVLAHPELSLLLADSNPALAAEKLNRTPGAAPERLVTAALDIFQQDAREALVSDADAVVSLLPASLHGLVLDSCIRFKKPLLTASYVSDEFRSREPEILAAGIPVVMECGLDPGIDHMTAMEAIDRIRNAGGEIRSFRSYTGGLVAPESDTNPWHYKFSWNPRNVVLAGQGGTARYIRNGELKYIPYHQLFRTTEALGVEGFGSFEGYANRDSLSYRQVYGLEQIPTLLRGTLRRSGYCAAWHALVQLGLTDDSFQMEGVGRMSKRQFLNAFLPYDEQASVEEKLCRYLKIDSEDAVYQRIAWLGLFTNEPLSLTTLHATPAQVLQHILEEKWALAPGDKDMIVMQHLIEYSLRGESRCLTASLVALGDNEEETAMAKTVGWPLAIATRLLLEGKISQPGIHVPVKESLYAPILAELRELGIRMQESDRPL